MNDVERCGKSSDAFYCALSFLAGFSHSLSSLKWEISTFKRISRFSQIARGEMWFLTQFSVIRISWKVFLIWFISIREFFFRSHRSTSQFHIKMRRLIQSIMLEIHLFVVQSDFVDQSTAREQRAQKAFYLKLFKNVGIVSGGLIENRFEGLWVSLMLFEEAFYTKLLNDVMYGALKFNASRKCYVSKFNKNFNIKISEFNFNISNL